jgi:hypothetical protein
MGEISNDPHEISGYTVSRIVSRRDSDGDIKRPSVKKTVSPTRSSKVSEPSSEPSDDEEDEARPSTYSTQEILDKLSEFEQVDLDQVEKVLGDMKVSVKSIYNAASGSAGKSSSLLSASVLKGIICALYAGPDPNYPNIWKSKKMSAFGKDKLQMVLIILHAIGFDQSNGFQWKEMMKLEENVELYERLSGYKNDLREDKNDFVARVLRREYSVTMCGTPESNSAETSKQRDERRELEGKEKTKTVRKKMPKFYS